MQPQALSAACTASLQFPHPLQGKNSDGVSSPAQQPCWVTRTHARTEQYLQLVDAEHSPLCHAGCAPVVHGRPMSPLAPPDDEPVAPLLPLEPLLPLLDPSATHLPFS